MTPEGVIKKKIKFILDKHSEYVYYYMPVPSGYGRRTVDYLGCVMGVFFAVEAKKPGARPTTLQEATLEEVRRAGGSTFVVRDENTLNEFDKWLDKVVKFT